MERDLVQRAQAGDHDAFETMAGAALERLYGTARLILLDADGAQDAARDALIAAWRDIRGLRDPSGLDPWLLGILVSSCQRMADAGTRNDTVEVDDSRQAFGGLTRDARTILALVFFAELSVEAAAVALGIPPASAASRRDDALDALRTALSLDDRAETRVDLEWRLRSWLSREAAPPDLTAVTDAVTAATISTRQRRGVLVPARRRGPDRPERVRKRRRSGRRLGFALVTALCLVVAVAGGVVVTRIVRPPEAKKQAPAAGLFTPTKDISPVAGFLEQPAIALLSDGRVLIVGFGEQLVGGIVYDPATAAYGDVIYDNVLRRGSTATTLQNSLVLLTGGTFAGGETSAVTAVLFDPVSETFATTNPLTKDRAGHTATLLDDGRVLVAGGRHSVNGSERLLTEASAEIYDPATGAFGATGTMVWSRAGHTATKLGDGRVLIAGGHSVPEAGLRSVPAPAEIFDPATGLFHATKAMSTPRANHSATLLTDGRVLIAGGADRVEPGGQATRFIADAEIFDPTTEAFVPVGSLVTERAGHSATLLADGRVLVAGGRNDIGEPHSSEIFDPTSATFGAGPFAAAAHRASVAPLVAGGHVLLTGSGPGGSELFDPLAGGVATVPSATPAARQFSRVETSVMRFQPLLVELDDGRTLILGGWGTDGEPIPEAEVFDPATGLISPSGTLAHRFSEAAVTRLPDGRIFIVGNADTGAGVAEVFDPATGTFGPARDQFTEILRDRHPLPASGLPAGRLMVSNGYDTIQSLDVTTGALGPPILACEYPRVAIGLDAGRTLVSCGNEFDAVIADPATGTAARTGLRFDRAIPLDARRIALVRASYLFPEPAAGSPYADRITWIYDPVDGSAEETSENVGVGETAVVSGDRLLTFGGSTSDGSSGASVAIDTRSWTSTDLGSMLGPRSNASAILLRDGRILIVGGARPSPDRSVPLPPGAELFDPSLVP